MMNYGLKDKIIFVTGGGSGIGRAIALMAARDGANVVVADAVAQRASAVAAELRDLGVTAMEETLDVRDGLACEAVVERIEKQLGPIDGMVACAGISTPSAATEMSDEIWSRCLDVNLTGMFLMCKYAVGEMRRAGGGTRGRMQPGTGWCPPRRRCPCGWLAGSLPLL
jgi:NAD(P)-dependent dehydrogenase (short-subunit alcohol dehydrogenase family)